MAKISTDMSRFEVRTAPGKITIYDTANGETVATCVEKEFAEWVCRVCNEADNKVWARK